MSRSGRTRPSPLTRTTVQPPAASSRATSPAPAATTASVGLAAWASRRRCDGCSAASSCSRTRRALAPAMRRRLPSRRSPPRRGATARSRSTRSLSATPMTGGHSRTAIVSSCGNGSQSRSRSAVRSASRRREASNAASAASGAVRTWEQSHHSTPAVGWCASSRRHATTRPAGSSANPARQSAASATNHWSASSPAGPASRARRRSRSNGCTVGPYPPPGRCPTVSGTSSTCAPTRTRRRGRAAPLRARAGAGSDPAASPGPRRARPARSAHPGGWRLPSPHRR